MSRVDVRGLRERMGLSREEMAGRLGVGLRTIERWEAGHADPSPMGMAALRKARDEHSSHGAKSSGRSDTAEPSSSTGDEPKRRAPRAVHLPGDHSDRLAPLAAVLPSMGRTS